MVDDTEGMGSIEDSLGRFECEEQGWKGFGSLTFNPDEGGRLKLFRPKSNNSEQFRGEIGNSSIYDVKEIEGQIEGRKRVKLVNCLSHSVFPVGLPLTDVYEFSFNSLFVADGNDAIPSEFDAVEFRMRHQDEWVGAPSEDLVPFDEWVSLAENPSHAIQISRPKPETYEVYLPGYTFIITRFHSISGSFGQMPRFSSEPSSSLRIEYAQPTSLSEILEVVNHISDLLSISFQAATPLEEVNLFREERKIQWHGQYGRLPKKRESSVRHVYRVHSFDNLGANDVRKWLDTVSPLSDAVSLILRHLYQDGASYDDISFSDVYRATETIVLHFSDIKERKDWNKRMIKSLLDEVRDYYVISPEVATEEEWIDSVVKTRNEELTHKRVDRKSTRPGTILEDDRLFYATQSLRQLTTIYLLSKCGVNNNFIRNLYEYRGILINHLQKNNPEESVHEQA